MPTRLWATLANLEPGHRGSAVPWEVLGALGEPWEGGLREGTGLTVPGWREVSGWWPPGPSLESQIEVDVSGPGPLPVE